ncbi:MAG TPA: MazG nucleotide pyrophosphohydrolase domain-containing protein [Jiangellales bacterium]|nr:MazG nucleotide pyrophosphohydrolase domain-containing protein [Jiangellales bacterium]
MSVERELRRLGDDVAAVSDHYAEQHGIHRTPTWYLLKLQEEVGELTQAFLMRTGQARDKGLSATERDEAYRAELADVLCHVLLLARQDGVDLAAEAERKWLSRHPGRAR